MKLPLFHVIQHAAQEIDSCGVAFSCGKDACVTLDLCCKHIKHVVGWFYYLVPELSFQESIIKYYEQRYNIQIHRIPYYTLAEFFRNGMYRPHTAETATLKNITQKQSEVEVRAKLGVEWLAYGYKVYDTFIRRGIICGKNRQGIDPVTHRFYPVGFFTNNQVFTYMRQHKMRLGRDYQLFKGNNFGALTASQIIPIYQQLPEDYERIKERFPFVEAIIQRWKFEQQRGVQVSAV